MRGWLPDLLGIHELRKDGGTPVPTRDTLNVVGSAALADNPSTGETDLTMAPYSGSSVLSPAQLTASQNDYEPAGAFSTADLVRVSLSAGLSITGLALSTARLKRKLILNTTDSVLTLPHESASSAAGNRFLTPDGTDIQLQRNGWADVMFDASTNRVRVLAYSAGYTAPS